MSGTSKKNSAVSPVIGTILLVAITVVLVAIIGVVVMSLADAEDGKKVGMNAQPDKNETAKAKLILYGGESLSELVRLEMIDHDSADGKYVELWNLSTDGELNVGLPYKTKEDVARPPKDLAVYDTRINVKGTFTDGREVVLLVQPMTFYDVTVPKIVVPKTLWAEVSTAYYTGDASWPLSETVLAVTFHGENATKLSFIEVKIEGAPDVYIIKSVFTANQDIVDGEHAVIGYINAQAVPRSELDKRTLYYKIYPAPHTRDQVLVPDGYTGKKYENTLVTVRGTIYNASTSSYEWFDLFSERMDIPPSKGFIWSRIGDSNKVNLI